MDGRIQNGEEGRGEGQQRPIMYKKLHSGAYDAVH